MLKIRLRRIGKKRTPYYRVVVAEKEAKRDGAFLETLGSYDPHANPPSAVIDADKTREWIRKGAQPSEAAVKVLQRAGIIDTPAPVRKQEPAGTGKAGAKATNAATAAPTATPAAAKKEAPAAAAVVAAEAAEAPTAAEEVAPAATTETEAVAEAAIEGGDSNEVAQEPGDDDVQADAPTVE